MLAGTAAYANPTGPTVVHGTAQFANPDATTLNATTSSNAIINWQGFSIDSAETTRFIQPSTTSAVLNRVTGSDSSSILGQLLSNGRVFLVNPHGIVFGEGAVVDTGGLVASTLGISDANFLAANYRFEGGPESGDIVNRGRIEAGADGVFLLAPSIENSGVVRTDGGDLVLAAGRAVNLTSLDLDGVQVEVQAPEDGVLNLGDLVAQRGAVGAFAGSIRNSGTVEANAVTVDDDGTVRLVAHGAITLEEGSRVAAEGPSGGDVHIESKTGTTWVSGEVSARASEGRGGTIRLLGRRVGLEGARVDASGPTGGGEVLVGGDESGEGPIPTADAAYVSVDSTVSADALDDGDGGKVVVFAEGFANILGDLSARGGPNRGDGGFVETSGRESFVILHTPDVSAPHGEGGHWLIDPYNITIVAGNGTTNITATNPFESTGDDAEIGIDLIIAALTDGAEVTVQTGAGGTQDGDITLDTELGIESLPGTDTEATLTLDAHGDIIVNEAITDAHGGQALNLVLVAGNSVWILADVTLYGGSLETEGAFVAVANGATVTLDDVTWDVFRRDDMNSRLAGYLKIGDDAGDLGTDTGALVVRNGAEVTAGFVHVGRDAGSRGTVTVRGSGSSLTTTGDGNGIRVGDEGNGTLHVLDGGLVQTLYFEVAHSGVGRAVIRGVAADGARSRVIVSPAHGNFTGVYADEAGFARVARNAGSRGTLEILEGGLLRLLDGNGTHGPSLQIARNKGSVGTVLIDGEGSSLEIIQNSPAVHGNHFVWAGPSAWLGRRGQGTTTIRNGGTLLVKGESAFVGVSRGGPRWEPVTDPDGRPVYQRSEVTIESGGRMEVDGDYSVVAIGDGGPDGLGTVTVTGSGSRLVTKGTSNRIIVGDEGNGTLHVLDGGLVETLWFEVARSGVGRAVIRGVAADGARSRVIVSPAHGNFTGVYADHAGFASVASNAGSRGTLEILEGGLLRLLDGNGTHGPNLHIARNKGSVGTVLIDGEGSSLEVIQNGPAVHGNRYVWAGPAAQLGRRGGATTTIRNGGKLLVRGEGAFVRVSRDSFFPLGPDPDTGPIDQPSVVRIESGGRMEVDGEGAEMVIGDSGSAADGLVTVHGRGSLLSITGAGNRLVVGDDGGKGRLDVYGGASVRFQELIVGVNGVTRISEQEEVTQAIKGVVADILPPSPADAATETETPGETQERAGEDEGTGTDEEEATGEEDAGEEDEEGEDEEDEEDEEDGEETSGAGESSEEETEELPMCPA